MSEYFSVIQNGADQRQKSGDVQADKIGIPSDLKALRIGVK